MRKILCMACVVMILVCFGGCKSDMSDSKYTTEEITKDISELIDATLDASDADTEDIVPETRVVWFDEDEDPHAINERHAEVEGMENVGWLTEEGILCVENGKLYVSTVDYGEKYIMCSKVGCTHKSEKSNVYGELSCRASVYDNTYDIAYYEGKVYFLVGGGNDRIVKMDVGEGEREIIMELSHRLASVKDIIFNGDYMYFMVSHDEDKDMRRVVELNIVDNSYRYLTEWCEISTSSFDMAGNTLYYRLTVVYEGQSFFRNIALDVNTLEERIVANHADDGYVDVDYFYYLEAYDGDSYLYIDFMRGEYGIRNVDKTVERVLMESKKGEFSGSWSFSCDGFMYKNSYNEELAETYFKDLDTREKINITEVAKKYSLIEYDGYYDMFYGINEDSEYIVYSKDKILSEAQAE